MAPSEGEEADLLISAEEEDGSRSVAIPSKRHTSDLHFLSFGFLFVFAAYSAAQNLQSTVNTENDLGTTSLGILYLSFTLFSLAASSTVKFMGSKNALVLGSTGYWVFIASNLKPSWYTMVPASLYLGFTASIIWVGQGTYLAAAARSHAKDFCLPEGQALGNFNGEFWGLFASTQIVGNLVSLALLGGGKVGTLIDEKGVKGATLLFSVFLGSVTLGTLLLLSLDKREERETSFSHNAQETLSAKSVLKSVVAPLQDKTMLLIIPLLVYSGLEQAFVSSELTKYVIKPAFGVSGVGGVMAVYGCFNVACSFIAGSFTSGIRSINYAISGGSILEMITLLFLLLKNKLLSGGELGQVYPIMVVSAWGVSNGIFNTQISALLALLFRHDTEAAFAQFKFWQSASTAAVFFLSPFISFPAMSLVLLICLIDGGNDEFLEN